MDFAVDIAPLFRKGHSLRSLPPLRGHIFRAASFASKRSMLGSGQCPQPISQLAFAGCDIFVPAIKDSFRKTLPRRSKLRCTQGHVAEGFDVRSVAALFPQKVMAAFPEKKHSPVPYSAFLLRLPTNFLRICAFGAFWYK